MTEVRNVTPRHSPPWEEPPRAPALLAVLWSARWGVIGAVVVAAVVAALVALALPERYAAEARLLVEPDQRLVVGLEPEAPSRPMRDRSPVENEAQVLASADTLAGLADTMRLRHSSEFSSALAWPAWWEGLDPRALLRVGDDDAGAGGGWSWRKRIVEDLRQRLDINGVGESFVLSLSFTASDPMLAEAVLDALLEARRAQAARMKAAELDRATDWLSQRIGDLRQAVLAKETEAQELRRAAGLARGFRSDLIEEQMSSVVTELSTARSRLLLAEARRQSMVAAVEAGNVAQVPDVVASDLIQELVQVEVERESALAELEMETHPQDPRRLAAERAVSDIEARIAREMANIAASIAGEAASYRAWVEELEGQLASLKKQAADLSGQEVLARAVTQEAEAGQEVLASLMETLMKLQEQQDVLVASGSVIQEAVTPPSPAYPQKKLIVLAAVVFAGAAAVALVAAAHLGGPRLRRRLLWGGGIVAGLGAVGLGAVAVLAMLDRPAADSLYGWMPEGKPVTALFRAHEAVHLAPGATVAVKLAGRDAPVAGEVVDAAPWTGDWPGGPFRDGGLIAVTVRLPDGVAPPVAAEGSDLGLPARVRVDGGRS